MAVAGPPLPVAWGRCPECGGLAGWRFEGGRAIAACFEGGSCWWVWVPSTPETPAPRYRPGDPPPDADT